MKKKFAGRSNRSSSKSGGRVRLGAMKGLTREEIQMDTVVSEEEEKKKRKQKKEKRKRKRNSFVRSSHASGR